MAIVPDVEIVRRHRVRGGPRRPGVPPGPGVLHVPAALPEIRPGMVVLRAGVGDGDRRPRPLLDRGDPPPDGRRESHPAGEGAPVGAAGAHPAGEGVGLLPWAVRPAGLQPGGRDGCVVHRHPRAAPRAQAARHRGPGVRGPVPGEHPVPGMDPARAGHRPARADLDRGRRDRPRDRPEVPGGPPGAPEGDAVHRAEHRGHAVRLRDRPHPLAGQSGQRRDGESDRRERRNGHEHQVVAAIGASGDLPGPPADPAVLRVQRRGRGSVQHRRPGTRGHAVGT